MNILLLRNGNRALILPPDKELIDCPAVVRFWLGTPFSESVANFTLDMPMPGINPQLVLGELLQCGFCALDLYGVVRSFETIGAGNADATPRSRRVDERAPSNEDPFR